MKTKNTKNMEVRPNKDNKAMRFRIDLILFLIIVLSMTTSLSSQTTVNLNPSDDAYLSNGPGDSGDSFGSCDDIHTKEATANGLLSFDISSIPAGATITSANLVLFKNTGQFINDISIHRMTAAWNEGSVCATAGAPNDVDRTITNTWSTVLGDFASPAITTVTGSTSQNVTMTFPITSLVQDWHNGTYSNNGLLVKFEPGGGGGSYRFDSKDKAGGTIPVLNIVYTIPPPSSPLTLTSTGDTHIQSLTGAEDYNYGAVDYMRTHPQYSVSLVKFDLSSIPSGAVVTNAVIKLTEEYTVSPSEQEVIYPMTTHWEEGNGTGTGAGTIPGATWNDSDGTGSGDWVTGTFSASDYGTPFAGTYYVSAGNFTYSADITSTVDNWVNGSLSNEGLVIKRAESTGNYFLYSTREEPLSGLRPQLVITYTDCGLNVKDEFNTLSYAENDGTVNWATNWTELNDDGLPGTGDVNLVYNYLKMKLAGKGAFRSIDLSSSTSAKLTFSFQGYDDGNDYFVVEASSDGGSNYTVLETILPAGSSGNETIQLLYKSYNLEDFISMTSNVVVRFRVSQGYGAENNHYASVDNVMISYCDDNLLGLSTSVTNECSGGANGTIDLTVSLGTAPYTFVWADGPTTEDRTGLDEGNYFVTVTDANSNTGSTSATVYNATTMSLSGSTTPASAGGSDGAIDLTVGGGGAPYTFSWSNGATSEDLSGLSNGTYSVSVTDACSSTVSSTFVVADVAIKQLYLTDPAQGLDRRDPVANTDATTASTTIINAVESSIVADNFNTNASYSGTNSNGTLDWTTDWIELDPDGGGAASGSVRVFGNTLQIEDNYIGSAAYRSVDLSSALSATLSFDFVNTMNHVSDETTISLSLDGGVTYPHILAVYDRNTVNGTKVFPDWVSTYGTLASNTTLRFESTNRGGASGNYSTYDNISIAYEVPSIASVVFTQGIPMCSDFNIAGGQNISVFTYATITSGNLPVNPSITATLEYGSGPTQIIMLANPTWDGTKLTWSGVTGPEITITAGQEITLRITSTEISGTFTIDYDSQTSPSRIDLPTTTYINVDALDVYTNAYNGGTVVTEEIIESTVYIRSTVSDPFGTYDITGLDFDISDPNLGVTNLTGVEVATAGCTKTYESTWEIPFIGGGYSIAATADEGTEGVTDKDSILFYGYIPITVTKTLSSPISGPYSVNDVLTFNIKILNGGDKMITSLPLQDIFDDSCLEYESSSIEPDSEVSGSLIWNDLGTLNPNEVKNISVTFKVLANCDPTINIARVEGAIFNGVKVLPSETDTIDVIIDEAPIAVDDSYYISSLSKFSVLENDIDPDNNMTTLTILSPPSAGSAIVNLLAVDFDPTGMSEDQSVTFTYQICDNTSPTPYCDNGIVTVVYSAINNDPILINDFESTTLNLAVTADVLANDSDVDGILDPSSVNITVDPQYGSAIVNPDGTITYTPNLDYVGPDQLTYNVCDNGSPLPAKCVTALLDLNVVFVHYACRDENATLSVSAIAGAESYVWDLPIGAVVVSGGETNTIEVDFSGVMGGIQTLCVMPLNYCGPGTEQCVDVTITDISLSKSATYAKCFGDSSGTINLTVSGGVKPYNFNWSNGSSVKDLINIGAGLYSVTVTDRYGCSAITSQNIGEPSTGVAITGAIITDENPYGSKNGSIDITVSGGTPGYTFEWKNSLGDIISTLEDPVGLAGGTYTVIVTDSYGCTDTDIFTVNYIGGPLSISSLLATNVNCFGNATGTIDLEIIGGSGSYSYDWSNDGTSDFDDPQDLVNLSAGTYTVVINDGINPSVSMSIQVTQPATGINANAVADNLSCFDNTDGSVNVTATGGELPYIYKWNTGSNLEDITGLTTGTYTVTVTDANGCSDSATNTITQPGEINISGILTENTCGLTDDGAIDITVTGGSGSYTFDWTNAATTEDVSALSEGVYSVVVTDNSGCRKSATFTINSTCIGVSKELIGSPVNYGNGTYSLVYHIGIKNYGNTDLNNVQVIENLSTTFNNAISFTLDNVTIITQPSNSWSLSTSYDGNISDGDATDATDDELLSSFGELLVGENALIRMEITVTPGSVLTYLNSAHASAISTFGKNTTDTSQNGDDPDPDNDGDPTNNNDPTPVILEENPEIGLAKILGKTVTNNQNATYSLSYELRVENTGDVNLDSIQISDDLQKTFPGLNLTNISGEIITQPSSSVLVFNSNYDGLPVGDTLLLNGASQLLVGEFAILKINLTVEIDGSLGVFWNTSLAKGISPASNSVSDISQDGSDVDPDMDGNPGNNSDPTPVSFTENPIVNIIKKLNGDPLNNLDGTFTINYQLQVSNKGNVPLRNLQVNDDLNAAFPGLTISDVSTSIITQPISTTLVSNVNYDGLSSGDMDLLVSNGQLNVGEVTILNVSLKVALDNSLGPFTNLATATAVGPGGTPTSDDDDEVILLSENPSIGVAKTVDTPINNENGSYSINYTILVENTGDQPLSNLMVEDDLSLTFSGALFNVTNVTSTTLSINGSYNGYTGGDINLVDGTNVLNVGQSAEIIISLNVTPGTNLGTYWNSALGKGTSPGGADVMDISQNGTDVDPDNDGDPTNNNDPTPVRFTENPIVGVAKDIISDVVYNNNGTYTFTYEIRVENMGNAPLYNVQVVDDLASTYALADGFVVDGYSVTKQPTSSTFTAASSYNGSSVINLLAGTDNLNVGDYGLIQIHLTVTPGDFGGPYNNSAIGFGTSPAGRTVSDFSQDGLDPDPDNDGIPTNNNVPTPVEFFLINTTNAEDDYNQTLVNVPVYGDISTNDFDLENDNQTITTIAQDNDGNGTYESTIVLPVSGSSTTDLSGFDKVGNFVSNAGSITVNSDGTYKFTPVIGFTGTAYMQYDVIDDNFFPKTDNAILVIDVTGPNLTGLYPPVAQDDNATTAPDINVDIVILINDSDVDGFLVISTIDLDPATPGIQDYYATPGEGEFTVNHTTGLVTFDPEPTFIGTTTPIDYQVCDNDGLCDDALITVVIAEFKNNTMTAEDDSNSGYSGEILTGNILINDIDPDGSDGFPDVNSAILDSDGNGVVNDALSLGTTTLIYGESANTPGMYVIAGRLKINNDGSYIYTSDSLFEGTVYVPYQACDNDTDNACASATLYLTTVKENSTVAEDDFNQTIVNVSVRGDVSTNDWDPEGDNQTVTSALIDANGDGLKNEVLGIGSTLTLFGENSTGVTVVAGMIKLNSDGTYDYDPATDFVGTVELIYTATDDNGHPASDDAKLVIDVTGPNVNNLYPPIALDDNATTEPDVNVEIPALDNDSDVDGVIVPSTLDLDPSVAGLQTTFTVPNEGTYTIITSPSTSQQVVLFDPVINFRGTTTPIDYKICDNDDLCDEAKITVIISDPTINEMSAEDDANSENCSGWILTGNILSNDIDPDGSTGIPSVSNALVDSDGDGLVNDTLVLGTVTNIYSEDTNNPGVYILAGTIILNSDGAYEFGSDHGFQGTIYIPYTACDNDIRNACDNATLYLTIAKDNPVVQITGASILCIGDTTNLSPISGGSWIGSDDAVATVSNSGLVTAINAGSVFFTFTSDEGCVSDATEVITVNPIPTIDIALSGLNTICIGQSVNITSTVVHLTGPIAYQWQKSANNSSFVDIPGATLSDYNTGAIDTTTHYRIVATSSNMCSPITTSASITVNVNDPINVVIDFNGSICLDEDSKLSAESTGGSGNYIYNWTGPNGFSASLDTINIIDDGNYNVTVSDEYGCIDNASAFVYEAYEPFIFTLNTTICEGEDIDLSINSASAGGYQWGPNANNDTTSSINVLPLPPSTTYNVTVTNDIGCTSEAAATINVTTLTSTNISGPDSLCIGEESQLSPNSGGTWISTNSGIAVVDDNGFIMAIGSGTVNFIFTDTITTCDSDPTDTLVVKEKPIASITGPTSICEGLTTTLSPTTGGTWISSNTAVATVDNNGIVTAIDPGNANFTFTNSITNCPSNATTNITVFATPTINLIGQDTICTNENTQLIPNNGGTWESTDTLIATIANNGIVTGVSGGTVSFKYTKTSSGCESDGSIPLTILPLPIVGITGNTSVCIGSTTTLTPTSGGIWESSNDNIATVNNSGVVTGISIGAVHFIFTADNGCVSLATSDIQIDNDGTIILSGDPALCLGETTQMTASVAGGNWMSSNDLIASVNSSGLVTSLDTGNVSIIYIHNSNSCFKDTSYGIVIYEVPVVSIIGSDSICSGFTTTLSPISGGTWSSSNPSIATVTNQGVVSGISGGRVVFTFTSDETLCPSLDTDSITIAPELNIVLDYNGSICLTDDSEIAPIITGGTAGFNYNWIGPNSFVSTDSLVSIVDDGNYALTVTDAYGCSDNTIGFVYERYEPFIFNLNSTICEGENVDLSVNSSTAVAYQWGATANNAITKDVTVTPSPPNTTYQVVITSDIGCQASASATINVIEKPNISIAGPTTICEGDHTNLSPTSGGYWVSNNNNIAIIDDSGLVTGLNPGSVTFIFKDTSTGCWSDPSTTFTVSDNNNINITGDNTLCIGDSTIASISLTGGAWTSSVPSVATIDSNGIIQSVGVGSTNINYTPSGTVCYYVSDLQITVSNNPTVIITGSSTICEGDNTYLSPTSGGIWSSGDTTIATVTNNGTVTGVDGGNVFFSWESNSTGCSNTTNSPISVVDKAAVSLTGPGDICIGEYTTLSPDSGGIWISSNNAIASVSSNSFVLGKSSGTAVFSFYESSNGCLTDETISVNVNGKPSIAFNGPSNICIGDTSYIIPATNGTWISDNASVATITNQGMIIGLAGGNAKFTYADTITGCISDKSLPLNVNSKPSTDLFGQTELCIEESITIAPSSGGTWFSLDTNIATITNAGVVTGVGVGATGFVFILNNTGCSSDTTSDITVYDKPLVSYDGPITVCEGGTSQLTPSTGGSWSSSNTNVATITTSGIVNGIAPGTAKFTFTSLATGCTNSPNQDFTVVGKPNVTITGPQNICIGGLTSLSPTNGGVWLSNDTTIATIENNGTITGIGGGSTTFVFTNSTTGCSSTNSSPVTVYLKPTVHITGQNEICTGSTTTLSPNSGGLWSSSNDSIATITSSGIVTGVSLGIATFTFVENSTGCASDASLPVSVLEKPTVAITGPNNICEGNTTTLSPTTGGNWTSNNPTVATVNAMGIVTGLIQGEAKFTFISDEGCTSDETTPITISGKPTIFNPGDDELCVGSSITLLPPNGGTWESTDTLIATINNAGLINGIAAGNVRFVYTEIATGCVSDTSNLITVNALTNISLLGQDSICIGKTTQLSPTVGGLWYSNDGSIATINNTGLVTGIAVGNTTFYFVNSSTECQSENSLPVNIKPKPVPQFLEGNQLCIGDTSYVVSLGSGTWESNNSTVATINNNGRIIAKSLGNVKFRFNSSVLCSSEWSANMIINGPPTIGLNGPDKVCIDGQTNVFPSSGGIWSSTNSSIATVTNDGLVTGHSNGIASFDFQDTTTGCFSINYVSIEVDNPPTVDYNGDSIICIGSTTNMTSTNTGIWLTSDARIATVSNVGLVTGHAPGKVIISLTDGATGCSSGVNSKEVTVEKCLNHDFNVTVKNLEIAGNISTNDNATSITYNPVTSLIFKPAGSVGTIVVANDGAYTFTGDTPGKYIYKVEACIAPATVGCPTTILEITVSDNIYGINNPINNLEFTTTFAHSNINTNGQQIISDLTANDKCLNSLGCTIDESKTIITNNSSKGIESLNTTGILTYTPLAGNIGEDTIIYSICNSDITDKCDNSYLFITINADNANNSVVAPDDFVFTIGSTPVSDNVIHNDSDPENDLIAVVPVGTIGAPVSILGGSYYIEADGDFTFTPTSGFSGPTEIVYTLCDDNVDQACMNATVHILVFGDMTVSTRVYLEGALMFNNNEESASGRPLMRDNLRNHPANGLNYIPMSDPYSSQVSGLDFSTLFIHSGPGVLTKNKNIDSTSVLSVSGENAIVDWVFMELRHKNDSTQVIGTRSALVQRDGDIVDMDGFSAVTFDGIATDSFYLVVRHRNHLGVMSMLVANDDFVDFTNPVTPVFNFENLNGLDYSGLSQKSTVKTGYMALWSGDFDASGKIKFTNPGDDQNVILFDVLFYPTNTTFKSNFDFVYGYYQGDFDLNGKAKFANPDDDKNMLFGQIILFPLNYNLLDNFDFFIQQIPK